MLKSLNKHDNCQACFEKIQHEPDSENNNIYTCEVCNLKVHKLCVLAFEYFHIKTNKKRQKGPSPKDYSTYERLKTQFDSLWICPLCLLQPGTKAPKCIYCETGPGVLVPCMIENRGDDRKEKNPTQQWIHLHCLELFGEYTFERDSDCYILKPSSCLEAPFCKKCPVRYRMDTRCMKCNKVWMHSKCEPGEKCQKCSIKRQPTNPAEGSKSKYKSPPEINPGKVLLNVFKDLKNDPTFEIFFAKRSTGSGEGAGKQSDGNVMEEEKKSVTKMDTDSISNAGVPTNTKKASNTSRDDKTAQKKNFKMLGINTFFIPKKGAEEIPVEYTNGCVENSENKSKKVYYLDHILEKIQKNVYYNGSDVLKGLKKVLNSVLTQNPAEREKVMSAWPALLNKFNPTVLQKFTTAKDQDLTEKFSVLLKYRVRCDHWPQIPKSFRHFEEIKSFEPSHNDPEYVRSIEERMISGKKPQCDLGFGCPCNDLKNLGPYNIEKMSWNSTCSSRRNLIECGEGCGCDLTTCKNRQIARKERKVIGVDVTDASCWGIDQSTFYSISCVLPKLFEDSKVDDDNKNVFIEKKLMIAIQANEKPWDMAEACKYIIQESKNKKSVFSELDYKYAKALKKAVKYAQKIDPEAFRIHSKGRGILCKRENGIPANEFIIEYFGEIYSPWRWFEKQDAVKQYLNRKNMKNCLPDFYNIMLEMHHNDPKGYNLLFVDPINKGSFASRFSHSCDPNCGTVVTVSEGKYVVAMYSLRDIAHGEELTFDYCSVTETEREHKQALCLCGATRCRGHYLSLISSKTFNEYLDRKLCFLRRNALLYQAAIEPLTNEDLAFLDKHSIRSSVLDGCPEWLKKWMSVVLKFVEQERQVLVESRKETMENPEDPLALRLIEADGNNLLTDRLQNLIITLDKIKYCINKMKTYHANGGNTETKTLKKKATLPKSRSKNEKIQVEENSEKMIDESDIKKEGKGTPKPEDRSEKIEAESASEERQSQSVNQNLIPEQDIESRKEDPDVDTTKVEQESQMKAEDEQITEENMNPEENDEDYKSESSDEKLTKRSGKKKSKPSNKSQEDSKPKNLWSLPIEVLTGPPLRILRVNEIIDLLWDMSNEESIISDLYGLYSEGLAPEETSSAIINEINRFDKEKSTADPLQLYNAIRREFLKLSIMAAKCKAGNIHHQAVSDILYFYAFTFRYFTSFEYPMVKSDPVAVRRCDLPDHSRYLKDEHNSAQFEGKDLETSQKTYSASFIWGQMCLWWKQTVEKPEASLSQDRRGTLSYPCFRGSFRLRTADFERGTTNFCYPYKTRADWLKHLKQNPAAAWPVTTKQNMKTKAWSYKNTLKLYGSFMFDGVMFEGRVDNYVDRVVNAIDQSEATKYKLFDEITAIFTSDFFERKS